MSDNVIELTDANFQSEALEADKPVLVDFWAPWCGPCRMVGPIIDDVAETYLNKLKVGKLNTDDNPQVATKYGIRSIPTILLFKNGEVVGNLMGAKPKQDFEEMIKLPGIGEYTARAIMAIAFNMPVIPMDGNVERVLKRVFYLRKESEISKDNLNKKKKFFGS